MDAHADDTAQRPLLRVVRGTPTAAELAAVVTVLTAASTADPAPAAAPRTGWSDPRRNLRRALPRGADAWRRAGRPG